MRRLSRAAIAGLVAAAALTAAAHTAEAADTLGSAAAGQGRCFGTAVAAGHLGEAAYAATLDREFGSVTPETGATVTLPARQTVSALWNGTPARSGNVMTVRPSWNGTLAAGASTGFGFTVAENGSDVAPAVGTCTAS